MYQKYIILNKNLLHLINNSGVFKNLLSKLKIFTQYIPPSLQGKKNQQKTKTKAKILQAMNQHWNGKENLEEQLFSISNEMDIFFFNN